MSSAEYTRESVQRIRAYAATGWPHGAVAAMMGWSVDRLTRIAQQHQIAFKRIIAKSKTPDLKKSNIRWDAKSQKAYHGSKSIYLPPAEGRILNALIKAGDYDWNMEKLSTVAEVPKRNLSAHVSQLRNNLESIGLTIARRTYELSRL